jgi:hypothetical protein
MAYKILNTDGTTLLLLADNTVNQSATSLSLVGKNVNAYGQYINNNFVRLLANSASSSSSPPRSPITGQLWFDTTSRRLKVYDGTFRPVSGAVVSAPSVANPPTPVTLTNPAAGDLWWDKDNFQLNVWDGSVWTIVGPTFPAYYGQDSGWVLPPYQPSVTDLDDVKQFVALLKNHHTTLGVLSTNSFVTTYSEFTATVNTSTVVIESGLTLFSSLKVYNTVTSKKIVTTNIVSTGTATLASIVVNGTATSISTNTGALQVVGGVGIGGNLYVGGKIVAQELDIQYTTVTTVSIKTDDVYTSYNSTPSSSTSTGAIVVAGGIGVNKGIYVGGNVTATGIVVNGTDTSISTTTGALVVVGGVGIGGRLITDDNAFFANNNARNTSNFVKVSNTSTGSGANATLWAKADSASIEIQALSSNNAVFPAASSLYSTSPGGMLISEGIGNKISFAVFPTTTTSTVTISAAGTTATSTTTGALTVAGGAGVGGDVFMGKVLSLTVSIVAPASPAIGMFAVADRVTWDPASKGSGNAYPVFYDGSAWNALY